MKVIGRGQGFKEDGYCEDCISTGDHIFGLERRTLLFVVVGCHGVVKRSQSRVLRDVSVTTKAFVTARNW